MTTTKWNGRYDYIIMYRC